MCEWLLSKEWCDVQLVCGGRTISAHRVVLASVSCFLRKLLLSSPIDETPTYIVLPDFDFEAMSAVLYYVYNGEVVIQKHKLDMFLDIVKAMQIFIDTKYLPKTCVNITYDQTISLKKYEVFSLDTGNNKDSQYITLKKGVKIQDILQQYSLTSFDFQDQQGTSEDLSEQQNIHSANLQSTYKDRQRSSFLRDLFIETYPRNGNVNGRSGGVLTISNERYHGPTSVLLTNANGKYPGEDATFSQKINTKHTSQMSTNFTPWYQIHSNLLSNNIHAISNTDLSNMKLLFENCNTSTAELKQLWKKYFPSHVSPLPTDSSNHINSPTVCISESVTNCTINSQIPDTNQICLGVKQPLGNSMNKTYDAVSNNEALLNSIAKSVILNHVLESPWCPRVPNNYRPFRRKLRDIINSPDNKGNEETTINDRNNNIELQNEAQRGEPVIRRISTNMVSESSNTSYSIKRLVGGSDYKCIPCDQVFTSNECLTIHMRRHSSSARYSCIECSKSFSQLRNFKYHMSVHRGTREFAATCTVCGKYFNDRGYLSSHMKIHRNRKEYKCSQCPKSFNQRVAYNMHVRIHTGVKPHVCGECGKAFSRKMLLKQHQRTHSGERPYACPHCDKRFADRSNMTLHLRLHTGIKPFSCSLCPKSFTKKHHLKSHLNFHTGAKPYACPRCKLAFTQSSNMRTHLKKCSAPEPATSVGNSESADTS